MLDEGKTVSLVSFRDRYHPAYAWVPKGRSFFLKRCPYQREIASMLVSVLSERRVAQPNTTLCDACSRDRAKSLLVYGCVTDVT